MLQLRISGPECQVQESCKLLPILCLQLLDDKANVFRMVRKTIETFSFEEEVVQKNHTFFTGEARLLLLMEVKTCLDRKMIKLLTFDNKFSPLRHSR